MFLPVRYVTTNLQVSTKIIVVIGTIDSLISWNNVLTVQESRIGHFINF